MTSAIRSSVVVPFVAALLVGPVAAAGAAGAGAAEPTLHGAPTTDLVDLDRVRLTGTGFHPGRTVAVVQCVSTATQRGDCTTDAFHVVPDAEGTFAWTMTVRRFVTTAQQGEVDCGEAPGTCQIAAVVPEGTWNHLDALAIAFDPSAPPAPPLVTEWTVDPVGTVDEDGVATVSGTFRCNRTARASLRLFLVQAASGVRAEAFGLCGTTRSTWSTKVRIRHSSVRYEPGPAEATAYGYGFEYYDVDEDVARAEVELRAAP